MRIGLFVPCYIDAFHPEVGIATLELLERFGLDVDYPFDQTCCGQPMTNSGCHAECAATESFVRTQLLRLRLCRRAVRQLRASRSRTISTRLSRLTRSQRYAQRTFELVEFLHDVLKVEAFPWAEFPHRVAYHNNCNALRGLGHASMSERKRALLQALGSLAQGRGIEVVQPARPDECCGFGGTFSVFEEGVSSKMGHDKVRDQPQAGAEYVVSADSSCMMHQQGCAERIGVPMKFIHIAQVLNGASA